MGRSVSTSMLVVGIIALGVVAFAVMVGMQRLSDRPAELVVTSEPPGGTVFVNDVYRGVSPVKVTGLSPGTYTVRVTRHHYEPWQQQVKLNVGANDLPTKLVYRNGGTVAVTTDPAGASVYMDGEPKGVTPVKLEDVDAGTHTLRLALVNHLEWEGQVAVEPGRTAEVQAPLRSRTEDFLLRDTKADPKLASKWLELFHYYVITHQFDKAPEALARSLDALSRWPEVNNTTLSSRNRVYAEVEKLWNADKAEVDYGDEQDIEKGRASIEEGFERALDLDAEDAANYGYLLYFYSQHNRVDKSNVLLEKGMARFPYGRDWISAGETARPRVRPGGPDEATLLLARLKKNPDDNFSRLMLITQYERDRSLDEAIAQYPELIKRMQNPTVRFTLLQSLGDLQERRSRNEDALNTYAEALKVPLDPKDNKYRAALLFRMSRLKLSVKDVEGAITDWEQAISVQPDLEYACRWRLALAELCRNQERYERARGLCQDVLRISKNAQSKQKAQALMGTLPKS